MPKKKLNFLKNYRKYKVIVTKYKVVKESIASCEKYNLNTLQQLQNNNGEKG